MAFGPSGGDDFNDTGNTTQTLTYAISPYTEHHFGQYADLELRYTHDQVLYSESRVRDSYSDGVSFTLASGREFQRIPWDITGSYRRVRYNDQGVILDLGRDDQLRTTLATISYVINRKWRPNFYIGYDNNDFATTSNEPKGVIYGLGFTWTPNPRMFLDLAYGHRFFGNNWYLDLNYQRKRSVFKANLTHDINSSRDEILGQQTFQQLDDFGNPIVDPDTGQPINTNPDSPTLTSEVYILSRLSLGYERQIGRRASLGINAYYSLRDFQVTQRDEVSRGINANWSHGLGVNTQANLELWWETFKIDSNAVDDT